eukprot:NODE_231_length_12072_cov_0.605780.p1 type:complete len:264 gc:universal NODE_231_length_12072_cov_0.605780:268-1059(+)
MLLLDNGTNFTANEFRAYLDKENIEYHFTSPGYKPGNGSVERLNLTILDYVRANIFDDNWLESLNKILPVLRFSYRRSIDTSTYELSFGLKAEWGSKTVLNRHNHLLTRWNDINNNASLENYVNREVTRKRLESKKPAIPIQLNDMVLVPNPNDKTKIDKEFVEPYRVVEILPYGNILTDNGGRFNQNQVKRIQDKITSGDVENINALYELPMTKSGGSVASNTLNQSVIGCYLDQNVLINLVNSKQELCSFCGLNISDHTFL